MSQRPTMPRQWRPPRRRTRAQRELQAREVADFGRLDTLLRAAAVLEAMVEIMREVRLGRRNEPALEHLVGLQIEHVAAVYRADGVHQEPH